jgi:hypothetical protein
VSPQHRGVWDAERQLSSKFGRFGRTSSARQTAITVAHVDHM